MSRKKKQRVQKKDTIVNRIDTVKIDIDYSELAKAIVAAEKEAEEAKRVKSYVSDTLAILTGLVFHVISFLGFFSSIGGFGYGIVYLIRFDWQDVDWLRTIWAIFVCIVLIAFVLLFSILLWKSAKEISREKDRTFIVAVFSAIASFAAVIVALVALCK